MAAGAASGSLGIAAGMGCEPGACPTITWVSSMYGIYFQTCLCCKRYCMVVAASILRCRPYSFHFIAAALGHIALCFRGTLIAAIWALRFARSVYDHTGLSQQVQHSSTL